LLVVFAKMQSLPLANCYILPEMDKIGGNWNPPCVPHPAYPNQIPFCPPYSPNGATGGNCQCPQLKSHKFVE